MHCLTLFVLIALYHMASPKHASLKTSRSRSSSTRARRAADPTGPVIHASFALIALLEINEQRSEIVFSCFLKASWAAGSPHGGQEDPFTPRLVPVGARRVDNAGFLEPVTTVESDGAHYHQVVMVTVAQRCPFVYAQFPFDTQTCLIRIAPAESDATLGAPPENATDVLLEPDFDAFQHEFSVQVGRAPAAAAARAPTAGERPRAALAVRVRLRRRLGPHLVRLYAPSSLLVLASWLAARIPVVLIRSRLPVTILSLLTLLLACTTAQQHGPSGEGARTAAHLWETGCLVFSVVSVLEAVLDMHLVVRAVNRGDPRSERVERRGARLYFWLYALTWAVFCLAYWLAYVPAWRDSLDDSE